jgi:hypothetical protein
MGEIDERLLSVSSFDTADVEPPVSVRIGLFEYRNPW